MIAKQRRSLMSTELIASGVRAKINQRLGGWAASPNFKPSDCNSEIKLHSASLEEPQAQIHALLEVATARVHRSFVHLQICFKHNCYKCHLKVLLSIWKIRFRSKNGMEWNKNIFFKLVLSLPKYVTSFLYITVIYPPTGICWCPKGW